MADNELNGMHLQTKKSDAQLVILQNRGKKVASRVNAIRVPEEPSSSIERLPV